MKLSEFPLNESAGFPIEVIPIHFHGARIGHGTRLVNNLVSHAVVAQHPNHGWRGGSALEDFPETGRPFPGVVHIPNAMFGHCQCSGIKLVETKSNDDIEILLLDLLDD